MWARDDRGRVLINKQFQIEQVAKFIAVHILALVIFGSLIYMFLDSELDSNLASAHVAYRNLKQMIFPIVLSLSLLNILFSSLLITFFVLYASHKIAGPLYRFKAVIDELGHRNLNPASNIRQGDQLQELASSLKRLIDTLSGDLSTLKSKIAEVKAGVSKTTDGGKDLHQPIEEMEQLIEQYRL